MLLAATGRAQVTAIRAGKLVDPETGTTAVNQIILVEGQNIKAIGTDVKIPAGATVIDLSNQREVARICLIKVRTFSRAS
jgi:imidazolonepropionase-like amidohydrolase